MDDFCFDRTVSLCIYIMCKMLFNCVYLQMFHNQIGARCDLSQSVGYGY